ncbi:MAG TPA: RDD family protein [Methanocella sp.]|nr:RDD family protein [Methanocella sp.]
MEFTKDAKQCIEDWLKKVIRQMTMEKTERSEIEKELRSSLYEQSEAIARERGSSMVMPEDVKKVCAAERSPDEIAVCYARTYLSSLERASFWRRAAAYSIDLIVTLITLIATLFVLTVFFPWLRQTPGPDSLRGVIFTIAIIAYYTCYFIVQEGWFGRTIGKRVMGIKVLKTNAARIGFREALLRNLTTVIGFPIFIVIDVLIMLVFFQEEGQRAFDRVADTIVVRTRG